MADACPDVAAIRFDPRRRVASTINHAAPTMSSALDEAAPPAVRTMIDALERTARIDPRNNRIGDAGVRALAEVLRTNATVASIDLRNNRIGDAGARALAEALRTNATVASINLRFNLIGDAGASALADALRTNATVTSINLGYNLIGDAGACALAEALRTNATIMSIDLWGNRIGDAGARALLDALSPNTRLECVDVRGNNVTALLQEQIARGARTNMMQSMAIVLENLRRANVAGQLGPVAYDHFIRTFVTAKMEQADECLALTAEERARFATVIVEHVAAVAREQAARVAASRR